MSICTRGIVVVSGHEEVKHTNVTARVVVHRILVIFRLNLLEVARVHLQQSVTHIYIYMHPFETT